MSRQTHHQTGKILAAKYQSSKAVAIAVIVGSWEALGSDDDSYNASPAAVAPSHSSHYLLTNTCENHEEQTADNEVIRSGLKYGEDGDYPPEKKKWLSRKEQQSTESTSFNVYICYR